MSILYDIVQKFYDEKWNFDLGSKYHSPCGDIYRVLANYGQVTSEHLPFGFYRTYKTVALAGQRMDDLPIETVKLKGEGVSKKLLLVCNMDKIMHNFQWSLLNMRL